jgi:predicted nucleic acid-binding Zn ribbon protein
MESPYCVICGNFIPHKRSATKYCSDKCRQQAIEDSTAHSLENRKKNHQYKEQFDHALVSQMKLTEDAVEARQKKISYGQLMVRRMNNA